MEIWLQQQTSAVMTALVHAQALYGSPAPAQRPGGFAPPPDLEADLGGGSM
ncbi:MAG: hypothetical protein QOH57_3364 [Mycobacterium sp.]|jgi:hypothetical protein|nr:hypothetical protein [Mycobacterium sp.]